MRLLDRYVLRNFLLPFFYCFAGFLAIWLVFDLADNGQDFWEAKVPVAKVALFYLSQLPAIMILCLPVGLLLAVLYSLSHMSRTNELISMLTAGISVTRILLPLLAFGLLITGVSMYLNYELAPHAEASKKLALDLLVRDKTKEATVTGQLFRNRADGRTWFVREMPSNLRTPAGSSLLSGVHVSAQDAEGNILTKYYAHRASYEPETRTWVFRGGKEVAFDAGGNVVAEQFWDERRLTGWSETPWRIAASSLDPGNLSVPELEDYLHFNSDFPPTQLAAYRTHLQERLAVPFACFLVVIIAAPLGIVYSRRGVLAGVASSIFLFATMVFVNTFFLALGKGGRIPPLVAAWAPIAVFGLIGFLLLRMKAQNRDLPRLWPRRA